MTDPNCNDQRIYIGRLGYEVELECIEAWDISGDTARIKGALVSTSVEEALVLRQQLNGYIGNLDEDVIPIVWNAHPAMNGFYRVRGGDVNFAGSSLRSGIFDFSLEVERVTSSAGPLFESVITGAVRTNSHGITGLLGWTGLPETQAGQDSSIYRATFTGEVLPGATSARANIIGGTTPFANSDVRPFYLPPENYIDGAAQILYGDTPITATNPEPILDTYRTVVGQQVQNDPRQVCLSNGIVRCFWHGAADDGRLRIQHWRGDIPDWVGGAVGTTKDYVFTQLGGTGINEKRLTNVVILRNTPEECALRFVFNHPSGSPISLPEYTGARVTLDIVLRRGARHFGVFIAAPDNVAGAANRITVARAVTEAGTAAALASGAGIMATVADAGGVRYLLASPATWTADTVNGALTETDADNTVTNFAIGGTVPALGGSTDGGDLGGPGIVRNYFHAASEKIAIVGR